MLVDGTGFPVSPIETTNEPYVDGERMLEAEEAR
jgi:hypothetical protein